MTNIVAAKRRIRAEARRLRRRLVDKDRHSLAIRRALCKMPEYTAAATVMFYVDAGDEVRTRELIADALREKACVVVPFCEGERLGLFRLLHMDELATGAYGIDEPLPQLQDSSERRVVPGQIDLVVAPGVAFDARGGRIGQGKGFYDRFLRTLDKRTSVVALAYECQIFPSVPGDEHDVAVDAIVSEARIYRRA